MKIKLLLAITFFNVANMLNASQADQKSNLEQTEYQKLVEEARALSLQDKNLKACTAAINKDYELVDFWLEQGASAQEIMLHALGFFDAKALRLALSKCTALPNEFANTWIKDLAGNNDELEFFDVLLADSRFSLGDDERAEHASPLQRAVLFGHTAALKRLLFLGVKPNLKPRIEAGSPHIFNPGYRTALEHSQHDDENGAEISRMLKLAHEGDFSFISEEERIEFEKIRNARNGIQGNRFTHLMQRETHPTHPWSVAYPILKSRKKTPDHAQEKK